MLRTFPTKKKNSWDKWQLLKPHCFTGFFLYRRYQDFFHQSSAPWGFFLSHSDPFQWLELKMDYIMSVPMGHDTVLKSGEYLFDTATFCLFFSKDIALTVLVVIKWWYVRTARHFIQIHVLLYHVISAMFCCRNLPKLGRYFTVVYFFCLLLLLLASDWLLTEGMPKGTIWFHKPLADIEPWNPGAGSTNLILQTYLGWLSISSPQKPTPTENQGVNCFTKDPPRSSNPHHQGWHPTK